MEKILYNHGQVLLNEESLDIISFAENVCMEECKLSLKLVDGEMDLRILN